MSVNFVTQWRKFGDRPALVFGDGRVVRYCDIGAAIAQHAARLGTGRQLILWEAAPTPDAVLAYLAALALGHPILPVAARQRADQQRELTDLFRPDRLHGNGRWHDAAPSSGAGVDAYHRDLALLLSTSGSTGSAKLVRLSARNLDSNAAAIAQYLNLTTEDRSALILPLHYSYGLSVLHAHLAVGASIFFAPSLLAPDFAGQITAAGCTNLSGVPYSFELMAQTGLDENLPPTLRFLTVAGGRLRSELVADYAAKMARRDGAFFVMYGQTEATARMAYLPTDAVSQHPDCIGQAIPGGTLQLIDEIGREITETGTVGELVYRGPNVMMGYAITRADLALGDDGDTLRTGDLAERLPNGFYRITGRRSRFSKIAGLRIAHDEIEQHLARHDIAAFVTGDDDLLAVAITEIHAAEPVIDKVAALTRLTHGFIRVTQWVQLPRLANGKPDYAAIRARADAAAAASHAPPNPVMAAFQETFAPQHVSARDSFVSLGGDSLAYLQLSLALESLLGTLTPGWERRDIASLSAGFSHKVSTSARHRWRDLWHLSSIDTDHFLRALAISLVVLHHATLWPLAGGAATLLLLAGFNLARFHGQRLVDGDLWPVLRAGLWPVVLYYPVLLAYCIYQGQYPWQSLLLVGNLGIDGYSTMPTPIVLYWFIEAYLQIMLIAALLFALPPLRRWVAARPLASGLVFLGFCVLLRETIGYLWHAGEMNIFFTPRILYVPALGWCLYFAGDRAQRMALSVLAVLLLLGLPYFENPNVTILWVRAVLLILSCLTLIWWTRIRLPLLICHALSVVAAASFSIYLFHNLPYYLWLETKDGRNYQALHFVLGILFGIGIHFALKMLGRRWKTAAALRRAGSRLWMLVWPGAPRRAPGE